MEGDLGAYIKVVSPPRVNLLTELQNSSPRLYLSSSLHEEPVFCHSANIQQCIDYLDKELQVLGYLSLYNQGGELELPTLINATHNLLRKYQRSNRYREELESRLQRYSADLDQAKGSAKRLRVNNDCLSNDISKSEELQRQLRVENSGLKSKCKSLSDELKRLKSQVQSNENQYRHELKKKERQHSVLKERMQQLLFDKNKCSSRHMPPSLDITQCLNRADGKRSTWRNEAANIRNEDNLTKTVVSNYEHRCTTLQAENRSLRETLSDTLQELHNLLPNTPVKSPGKDELELPVDAIHSKIYASIRQHCDFIKKATATRQHTNLMDTTFTIETSEPTTASSPKRTSAGQNANMASLDLTSTTTNSPSGCVENSRVSTSNQRSPGRSRISEHRHQVKLAVEERDSCNNKSPGQSPRL